MLRITKKPTQDGTFTVYVDAKAVAWGLTTSAADDLISKLRHTPGSSHCYALNTHSGSRPIIRSSRSKRAAAVAS